MKVKRENLVKIITEQVNFQLHFNKRLNEARKYMKEGGKPSWWPGDIEYPKWDSEAQGVKKWEVKSMLSHIKKIAQVLNKKTKGDGGIDVGIPQDLIRLGVNALVKQDAEDIKRFDSWLEQTIRLFKNEKGYSQFATTLYPIIAFLRDKYSTGQGGSNDVQSGGAGGKGADATAATAVTEDKNKS